MKSVDRGGIAASKAMRLMKGKTKVELHNERICRLLKVREARTQGATFKEIGQLIGVSRTRAMQLHSISLKTVK